MATKDAVKQYTNARDDARVSILTNPTAVVQMLTAIGEIDAEASPELAALARKLEKAGLTVEVPVLV